MHIMKRGDVFFVVILTQSRSYQTSESPLSMGLQNLICPCELFPEELANHNYDQWKEKDKDKGEDPISS